MNILVENKISYYEAALIRVFVRLVDDQFKFRIKGERPIYVSDNIILMIQIQFISLTFES